MNLVSNVLLPLALSTLVSHDHDPDQDRSTCEIIQLRGFPCEIHPVVTPDGYIVELHRIPRPYAKPVMLIPGLVGSSVEFVMATNKVSHNPHVIGRNMAFELWKQGYDVWMTNNRGSRYGQGHLWLSPKNNQFWEFCFDDISLKDIPAYIHYVRRVTAFKRVHVIGHSQGTAVIFALLSRTRKYDYIIHSFTAICPITRIKSAKTMFKRIVSMGKSRYQRGGPAFTKQPLKRITDRRIGLACELPISRTFCILVYSTIIGPNLKQLDVKRIGVYTSQVPTTTSAKNVLHFEQLFTSNNFQQFDFGTEMNLHKYGTSHPRPYNLSAIRHPNMYIIYARNDWYVPMDGIKMLKHDLKTAREFYEISDPKANHMDPLIGIDVAVEVNRKIIKTLAYYSRY